LHAQNRERAVPLRIHGERMHVAPKISSSQKPRPKQLAVWVVFQDGQGRAQIGLPGEARDVDVARSIEQDARRFRIGEFGVGKWRAPQELAIGGVFVEHDVRSRKIVGARGNQEFARGQHLKLRRIVPGGRGTSMGRRPDQFQRAGNG
jgi:hypothetical protein